MANVFDRAADWWKHRTPRVKQAPDALEGVIGEGFKNGIISFAAVVLPLLCAIVATLAAGYFFNSGKDFDGSTQAIIAYGLAAITEIAMLAAFLKGAGAFWNGRTWQFVIAMGFGLMLLVVSTVAQIMYLSSHIDTKAADAAAATVAHFPGLGLLFGGAGGGAWVIITRAAIVGVVELGCSFVLARTTVSHTKKMAQTMERNMERMFAEQFGRMLETARRQHERNMAEQDMLEEVKDNLMQGGRDDMMLTFRPKGNTNGKGASNGRLKANSTRNGATN